METITKKEFKERIHVSTYKGNGNKFIGVFFDWKEGMYDQDGIKKSYRGYKFMLVWSHCTKKDAINEAYNRLFAIWEQKKLGEPYKSRMAIVDQHRFKVPIGL